jgi:hypothetical protein
METPKALVSKKETPHGNRSKAGYDFNAQVSLDNADAVIDGATRPSPLGHAAPTF